MYSLSFYVGRVICCQLLPASASHRQLAVLANGGKTVNRISEQEFTYYPSESTGLTDQMQMKQSLMPPPFRQETVSLCFVNCMHIAGLCI